VLLLLFEQSGFAQTADVSRHFPVLPAACEPESFRPVHLRYLSYDRQNSDFKVLMDKGSSFSPADSFSLEDTTRALFDYFLIGISLPNKVFWVNLRPDAAENIIDPLLARTDMGRVLLEADLQLKKDTAQMLNPDTGTGREYWDKLYKKAGELFGLDNMSIPVVIRPWITPGEIILSESPENAYIYKANLKVMLEADYLKGRPGTVYRDKRSQAINEYAAQLARSLVIPKLTYQVNTAKRYAPLRQVYYSLILAQWFKQRFYGKGGYYSWLIDREELSGLASKEPWSVNVYFDAYRRSFENGEFNTRENIHTIYGQSIRNYCSGGIVFESLLLSRDNPQVKIIRNVYPQQVPMNDYAVLAEISTHDMRREVKVPNPVFSQDIRLAQYAGKENEHDPGVSGQMDQSSASVAANEAGEISSIENRIKELEVQRASLREDLFNYEQVAGSLNTVSYQSSSPILLPILAVFGIGAGLGYLMASHKINRIKSLIASKDAQIDSLSKQVKLLADEVRSLRKDLARPEGGFNTPYTYRSSPPMAQDDSLPGGDSAASYAQPRSSGFKQEYGKEFSLWIPAVKAAYSQWLGANPGATTRERIARLFFFSERELLRGIGESLDLDDIDAQFIKGLVDFVVRTGSEADKGRAVSVEDLAVIRLEVESKIGGLLADKDLLARKIRKAIQEFSIRSALEATVLEGYMEGRGALSRFLDDKNLEYQNAFAGFAANKLEIAWVKYKQLDSDDYLRSLYEGSSEDNRILSGIEESIYLKISQEIPELKDIVVSRGGKGASFRTSLRMFALFALLSANIFTTSLSAAVPAINNITAVEMVEQGMGVAADTTDAGGIPEAGDRGSIEEKQIFIPVDHYIFKDTLGNAKLAKYYEIVKMGETQDTKKVRYLRRVLRQHDDSQWEGLSPGALLKFVSPIAGSSKPSLNAEMTVGGIFDFLKSGVVHILALNDEAEPSNRVAAAWALGNMEPALKNSSARRGIVDDLMDALVKDKDPYVRASAAWALGQYYDSHNLIIGRDRDNRIESLAQAVNDQEWLVRYYVVQALSGSDDPRAIQPILNLLAGETNPYVISAASQAALKLNSLGAVLPVIQTLEKLKFNILEDEILYALDAKVASNIAQGLITMAQDYPQFRQQVIVNFMKALEYLQVRQDLPGKYEVINYNYLPVFKLLVSQLKIGRAELDPYLKNIDPRVSQAIYNIVEPLRNEPPKSLQALADVEKQYTRSLERVKRDNPAANQEIHVFMEQGNCNLLSQILLFDRQSSTRRILAADALSGIDNNGPGMRALIAALTDSHPLVRSAAARSLRNFIAAKQFVYTGSDGSIIKAFERAVHDEDWIVVAYLIDSLRMIGDADALQAISAALSSGKHQFISLLVSQALSGFTAEGAALTQPLLRIFSSEADYDTYSQAIMVAKEVLNKTEDPLLIDGIINLLVRSPENPEDYLRYSEMRGYAIEALSQSPASLERLLSLFQEKKEKNDYAAANRILSVIQMLVGAEEFQGLSRMLEQGMAEEAITSSRDFDMHAAADSGVARAREMSAYTSVIFDTGEDAGKRIGAVDKMGDYFSGSGDISATEQLLNLIDSEANGDIVGHAISAALKINSEGHGMISRNGHNPMVKAFAAVANSNRSYEIRRFAIEGLGKSRSAEAAEPLSGLLRTLDEPVLIMAAVDAAEAISSIYPDKGIMDAMAEIFIEKLDFGPAALEVNPGIIKTQNKILNNLSRDKTYASRSLNRLLKDELSRSFKEQDPDKVDNIRYLMALVSSRKASPGNVQSLPGGRRTSAGGATYAMEKIKETAPDSSVNNQILPDGKSEGTIYTVLETKKAVPDSSVQASITAGAGLSKQDVHSNGATFVSKDNRLLKVKTFSGGNTALTEKGIPVHLAVYNPPVVPHTGDAPVTDEAQKEINAWIDEVPASQRRAQELIKLGNSGNNIYINPFLLRTLRNDLNDADENIRIAASYVYSKINPGSIYHIPNTNIDVELLSKGLNSADIGFRERLFKIIALGKSADPLGARSLLKAYYKIQEIYPSIERQVSERENEKLLLTKTIESSLENMREAAVDELSLTIGTRFNQGKLDYTDLMPMFMLERFSPRESENLLSQMHLKPALQSQQASLVGKYTKNGHFYQLNNNLEKKALAFQWDSYNRIFDDNRWEKHDLPADLGSLSWGFINGDYGDPQMATAAAIKLGLMQDVRAVWALAAGLKDDDESVVAASAWGFGQFESPMNEQDVRIPFLKECLDKHAQPFIRANVAFALGTSGDPRAMELLEGMLGGGENSLVKIFAVNSAKNLIHKFKSPALTRGLLALAKEDYNYDPLTIIGRGINWGPVGEAAFDAINEIGEDPGSRPVIVKGVRDALSEELTQETKNIQLINDVYRDLLERFGNEDYPELSGVMSMAKYQYWLPIAAVALGGILILGGLFAFVYLKIFRSKPKLLAEVDTDGIIWDRQEYQPFPPSGEAGAGGMKVGKGGDFSAQYEPLPSNSSVSPTFKAAIKEWEVLLSHPRISEEDVSRILQLSYMLVNLTPFSLAQNGNDLEARASQADAVVGLLQSTLERIIAAVKSGDFPPDNKIGLYAKECIEICRYFSDYRLALGYVEDLHLSANYPARNGKAKWRKIWGIENIAIGAKENLAYLLQKIYTRGNRIAPYLYRVPGDKNEYINSVNDYYGKLKPSKLGIARLWYIRKEMTRLFPLYFGLGFGIFTAITGFSSLIGSFTMGHILWYLFRVLTSSFMGVGISTYFSWQFIKKGWQEEFGTFRKLHLELDKYEELLRSYFHFSGISSTREQMLDEEIKETVTAVSQELEGPQASADIILVMTGTDVKRGRAVKESLQWLVKPDVPIFAVCNDLSSAGRYLDGSIAAFVKSCSYFLSAPTLGGLFDELSADKGAVCLNGDKIRISSEQSSRPMNDTRVVVIRADSPRSDWLDAAFSNSKLSYRGHALNSLQAALANGYRIAQALKRQGRTGVIHLNGDGIYIGPVGKIDDGLTVFASWSSQEQMIRQGLGLLVPDGESRITKYYDKFKIAKISNWLEREMIGGKYDLRNTQKRQMIISTGILVASFDNQRRYGDYMDILRKIRQYLISNGTPGNLRVTMFPDIIIPMVMLSQGENIYTYLEARLRNLAEEFEFASAHKAELREFYLGLYKIIEEGFPTDRPFIFPVQIPYPNESVYSRGSPADLASVLRQYGFSGEGLPSSEERGFSSSPLADGASGRPGNGMGGIDFRNLNASVSRGAGLPGLGGGAGGAGGEWSQINLLIRSNITPSVNRMIDYLKSDTGEPMGSRVNKVRAGIADIFRMEEETAAPANPFFKELLEAIENNPADAGLEKALSGIAVNKGVVSSSKKR
jgi:HEAT repeat protein